MKNLPLWHQKYTYQLLWVFAASGFLMAFLMLAFGDMPINGAMLALPWMWIGSVAAHTSAVLRNQAKRIERLEERLERERERTV